MTAPTASVDNVAPTMITNDKKFYKEKLYVVHVKDQNSNLYVYNCFKVAFKLIKDGLTQKIINGPINKTKTLNKKYLGLGLRSISDM